MSPQDAIALYREARSKRPNLPFLQVKRMRDYPPPKVPPSKQRRKAAAWCHKALSTHDRAVHGQRTSEGLNRFYVACGRSRRHVMQAGE